MASRGTAPGACKYFVLRKRLSVQHSWTDAAVEARLGREEHLGTGPEEDKLRKELEQHEQQKGSAATCFLVLKWDGDVVDFNGDYLVTSTNPWLQGVKISRQKTQC
eukprot:g941.t1